MNENSNNDEIKPELIKFFGWVLIILGAILAGGVGTLMIWINNAMTSPTSTIKFDDDSPQTKIILPILGVVVAFGVSAVFTGVWQVKKGKRSNVLLFIMFGLSLVLLLLAKIIPELF